MNHRFQGADRLNIFMKEVTPMKKLVSLILVATLLLGLMGSAAMADDKPTLRLITMLHTEQTAAIEDLYIFKYIEKYFNVNLDLEAVTADSAGERATQLLLSDDVYDLMWLSLGNSDAIKYGVDSGELLDWTPYLNEETMPNAMKAKEAYPDAFAASIAPDGKQYSMPYIRGAVYDNNTGAFSATIRVNINQDWLKAVGKEMPTTIDEFLDVARAFKEQDPGNVGEGLIPIIDNQNKIKDYIWNALGFYAATGGQTYGTAFSIKNGKVVLPAYTPEAKIFMETMKTMFDEGLVSRDYFTLDQTANRGIVAEKRVGIFGDSTLQPAENDWQAWWAMSPLASSVNDLRVASVNFGYSIGSYAAADTKYPELVAAITDFMYSDLGAMLYQTGPMQGTEEAEIEGCNPWWINDEGIVVNDLVANNPTYTLTNGNTAFYYIAGCFDNYQQYRYDYAGVEHQQTVKTLKDVITGREVPAPVTTDAIFQDDSWDHRWRVSQTAAMEDYLTFIRLPSVYLTSEQEEEVTDLKMAIEDYITQETPKFITGARSLDEFEAYQNELKGLGIERYIEIYSEAYAPFMNSTFGE